MEVVECFTKRLSLVFLLASLSLYFKYLEILVTTSGYVFVNKFNLALELLLSLVIFHRARREKNFPQNIFYFINKNEIN